MSVNCRVERTVRCSYCNKEYSYEDVIVEYLGPRPSRNAKRICRSCIEFNALKILREIYDEFLVVLDSTPEKWRAYEQLAEELRNLMKREPTEFTWKCICGICNSEIKIKEWMDYNIIATSFYGKSETLVNYPVPHYNRSHKCDNCGFLWELVENNDQIVVPNFPRHEIYLITDGRKHLANIISS